MTWLDLDPRAFAALPPDLVALLPLGIVPTLTEPAVGEPAHEVPVPGLSLIHISEPTRLL